MELKRNGIRLAFDKGGKGEKAFLFIHGVGTNRQFLSPQFEYFCQKGQALNVDLRGHGQSDKPEQIYTMEGYAEDLAWLCEQLKIKKATVIAHSMGGNIALELHSRFPNLLSSIVLLDTNLFFPESALLFLSGRLEALKNNFAVALEEIVKMRCLPTDTHQELVKRAFFATPQYVWCSSLEKMMEWDKKNAEKCVRNCHIPVLYIEGPKLVMDLSRFEACYPAQLIRGKVVGSGHFLTLEVPEQVNPMIDRFNFISEHKK